MNAEAPSQAGRNIPGFVYPLLFLGGGLPLWPFAARLRSPALRVLVFLMPIVVFGAPLILPWNWLLVSPAMVGANAVFAMLFLLFHPPRRSPPRGEGRVGASERFRKGLALAVGGLPFGLILAGMEQWLTDALWSGYYPVNASLDSISREVGAAWVLFALVLTFTSFHVSPWLRPVTPTRVLRLLLWTFAGYLFAHQLYLVLVAIPEWQTEVREIFPPWVGGLRELLFQALVYTGVPAALGGLFKSRGPRALRDFAAGLAAVGLSILAMAFVTGMPIHDALLLGQQAEKSGRPVRAIPWYSRALTWSQSGMLKSYLQFRVGLLYRKTGRLEEARDAFVRVLVRYPQDEELLADADDFKEKLQAGGKTRGRRVVIPGIEARTEYKSAYCVPNSLGLVLNFWGDRTGAKRIGSEITQLDRGSLLTDEVHFAESRGFTSLVLPLCSREQVIHLINAGIPVLAFFPGHVIAVFGYDEALGTLVTYDVNTFDIWDDQRWIRFDADWCQTYNTLGVVVPKELLPKVRKILGTDVEARSEAYVSYLIAALTEGAPDLKLRRLRRALGRGFFPAGWEQRSLSGEGSGDSAEDAAARSFLLAHETGEDAPFDFALDQMRRGRPTEAAAFLRRLGEHRTSSPSWTIALAGAELRQGKADEAAETLRSIPVESLDPAAAFFLLRAGAREGDDGAVPLSLNLLGREELRGDESRLAFQVWRAHADFADNNFDDALNQIHAYLDQWHPYDTAAIAAFGEILGRKVFRPSEERDERAWRKRGRLLEVRRARLEWAGNPHP